MQCILTTLEPLLLDLPVLTPSMQVGEVLDFLDQSDYSHLAVVDSERTWLGTLATALLYEVDATQTVASLLYHATSIFVQTSDGLAKLVDAYIQNKCNVLPVLNESMQLVGMLPQSACTPSFLQSTFLSEPGTTLILEGLAESCSFSKVTQIVESNNCKLLGLFILHTKDNKIQLLLRLAEKNIETIIHDFRRFDFEIVSQHEEDLHQTKLVEHSNYLNKFLNI